MGQRKIQVTILCEDKQQQVFARHFLIKSGFEPRTIRVLPLPDGKQSGEQYSNPKQVVKNQKSRNKSDPRYFLSFFPFSLIAFSPNACLLPVAFCLKAVSFGYITQLGLLYVRETYPEQVKLYRGKSTYLSCFLIVVIDAGLPEDAPPSLQSCLQRTAKNFIVNFDLKNVIKKSSSGLTHSCSKYGRLRLLRYRSQ